MDVLIFVVIAIVSSFIFYSIIEAAVRNGVTTALRNYKKDEEKNT